MAIFPNGCLQRLRVGATNGLGIKYLTREDARTVGLLGSGWQAGAQVMAVDAVRPVEQFRCFSPNPEHRERFAREIGAQVGVNVTAVDSPEAAVRGADIILCATNTLDPIFFERWIESGMHLSAIKRQEIEPAAIRRADRVVLHNHDASQLTFTAPSLKVTEKAQAKSWALAEEVDLTTFPELTDLLTGRAAPRASADEVTCFINNLGIGCQFAAAGAAVYREARRQGRGHELPTEWFTEDVHL
jgi:alanine dehydrogenase